MLHAQMNFPPTSDTRVCVCACAIHVCSEMLEVLRDKERRAQQQLDRCAEERGRKMEEQRRKEQNRRAAAEEKRRQQQEAEKVRGHSTLMMHSQHIRGSGKTGWQLTATDTEIIFVEYLS